MPLVTTELLHPTEQSLEYYRIGTAAESPFATLAVSQSSIGFLQQRSEGTVRRVGESAERKGSPRGEPVRYPAMNKPVARVMAQRARL
jgi:hypothetical protein